MIAWIIIRVKIVDDKIESILGYGTLFCLQMWLCREIDDAFERRLMAMKR
jgi:hypothetical protein